MNERSEEQKMEECVDKARKWGAKNWEDFIDLWSCEGIPLELLIDTERKARKMGYDEHLNKLV